jgi:hypothetical protein
MTNRLLLALICCFAVRLSDAATQVPYAALYKALEPGVVINSFDRLSARQRVQSRIAGVRPITIEIKILAKTGVQTVPISDTGNMAFPMSAALLAENPTVQSNQPKGSLILSATMEVKLPTGLSMDYADLYASALQADAALKKLGQNLSARRIRAIEFEFSGDMPAKIEIHHERAEELLLADDRGMILLRVDETLKARGARVVFSRPPDAARPHLD